MDGPAYDGRVFCDGCLYRYTDAQHEERRQEVFANERLLVTFSFDIERMAHECGYDPITAVLNQLDDFTDIDASDRGIIDVMLTHDGKPLPGRFCIHYYDDYPVLVPHTGE